MFSSNNPITGRMRYTQKYIVQDFFYDLPGYINNLTILGYEYSEAHMNLSDLPKHFRDSDIGKSDYHLEYGPSGTSSPE